MNTTERSKCIERIENTLINAGIESKVILALIAIMDTENRLRDSSGRISIVKKLYERPTKMECDYPVGTIKTENFYFELYLDYHRSWILVIKGRRTT